MTSTESTEPVESESASREVARLLPQIAFLCGLLHGGSDEDYASAVVEVNEAQRQLFDAVERVYVADTIPFPRAGSQP